MENHLKYLAREMRRVKALQSISLANLRQIMASGQPLPSARIYEYTDDQQQLIESLFPEGPTPSRDWFVYELRAEGEQNPFYVGITTSPENRVKLHRKGKVKSTALVAQECRESGKQLFMIVLYEGLVLSEATSRESELQKEYFKRGWHVPILPSQHKTSKTGPQIYQEALARIGRDTPRGHVSGRVRCRSSKPDSPAAARQEIAKAEPCDVPSEPKNGGGARACPQKSCKALFAGNQPEPDEKPAGGPTRESSIA